MRVGSGHRMEASMQLRRLVLVTLCTVIASSALAPAFADDDWRWRERHERREREEWRERAWREREWREHHYPPPVVATPPYGFYAPPPAFYPPPPAFYPPPGYVR
jgi:hypothetical protein